MYCHYIPAINYQLTITRISFTSFLLLLSCLSSNGNLNLDTSLDVDDDLLDNLGGGRQVDQALVDAHLVEIPGLGTLTAGGLAGLLFVCVNHSFILSGGGSTAATYGDLEGLGGQADGALGAEVLVLGALDELLADLLEGLDLARGEGDACGCRRQFGVSVSFRVPAGGRDSGATHGSCGPWGPRRSPSQPCCKTC